jgi:hypothetical protein
VLHDPRLLAGWGATSFRITAAAATPWLLVLLGVEQPSEAGLCLNPSMWSNARLSPRLTALA